MASGISICDLCKRPGHASETDDEGRHPACVRIQELGALISLLAPSIDRALNPDLDRTEVRKTGFILCAFDFGDAGSPLSFISNGDASDVANALAELLERLPAEVRTVTLSGGST